MEHKKVGVGGWEVAQLALAAIGAPAVPSLLELLGESDREFVAAALGEIDPNAKAAIPALTALLEDQEEQVVTRARQALAKIQQQ